MTIHRFHNPKTMHATRGYSHVVETTSPSRTIYLAGQLGRTVDGKFAGAPGDFRAQAVQAFENIKTALAAAGATFEHVVKVNSYFVDIAHLPIYLEVRDQIRRHRSAAGLDRHSNLKAGARGRAVRDRSYRRGAA